MQTHLFNINSKKVLVSNVGSKWKLLLLYLGCYIAVFVLYTVPFIISGNRSIARLLHNIIDYLVCEEGGSDPNHPCDSGELSKKPIILFFFGFVMLYNTLPPALHFIFVVNWHDLKGKCQNKPKDYS